MWQFSTALHTPSTYCFTRLLFVSANVLFVLLLVLFFVLFLVFNAFLSTFLSTYFAAAVLCIPACANLLRTDLWITIPSLFPFALSTYEHFVSGFIGASER